MEATALAAADPRPLVEGGTLVGVRCRACGHPNAAAVPRCARCSGETAEARFGPDGTVWATTTFHVASGTREAPYTLAYVDLDDGPRLLAHVEGGAPVRVAGRVRLVGVTEHGDPAVEVVE